MEAGASVRLPSPRSIWAGLSPEERTALLLPWWDLEESEARALRAGLVRAAARQFHFREQSLRNRDVAIARVARLPGLTDHLANGVAKAYLLNGRTDLLSAFLDAMGIAHEGGVISSSPNMPLQPHSKALAALEAIRPKFPEADIRLYLAALSATDQSWVDASALLAALGEGEATPAELGLLPEFATGLNWNVRPSRGSALPWWGDLGSHVAGLALVAASPPRPFRSKTKGGAAGHGVHFPCARGAPGWLGKGTCVFCAVVVK